MRKFKKGDKVVLNFPETFTPDDSIADVTVKDWKRNFKKSGGYMLFDYYNDADYTQQAYFTTLTYCTLMPTNEESAGWDIPRKYIKLKELTVNKLGNFPRKKQPRGVGGKREEVSHA